MRAWIAIGFCVLSACSFVVGTNKYIVGDAGDVGDSGDATVIEAGDDSSSADAPYDAGSDAPQCFIAGCLAEAGVCGTGCGVTAASCISNCSNQPCKNNCMTAETACRNACAATCNACTVSAGCQNQTACTDAAAM